MKRVLTFVALLALVCAGFASAGGLAKITQIVLKPGHCVTVKLPVRTLHVCAAKAKPPIVITKTVTLPGVPPPPVTVTVTTTVAAPPPPPPTSHVSLDFNSIGQTRVDEAAFTLPVAETLTWTSSWPDGGSIGHPNGDFNLWDVNSLIVNNPPAQAGNPGSGSLTLSAGTHQLTIIDEAPATWAIHIR